MRIALLIGLGLAFSTCRTLADDAPPDVPVGELAGVVIDEAGQPMEGVLVDCWTWYKGNETKTDQAGHFHLKGLRRDGPIELRISKPGYSPWYEVNQPTGVGDLKVTLNDKTFFEGTVLAPDGKPVPNALVRADAGLKVNQQVHITHVWTETRADANGHYKFFVAPDDYTLECRDAKLGIAYFRATAKPNEGFAQDVRLEQGSSLIVRCLDQADEKPVAGVKVYEPWHKGCEAISDADGKAVLEHLPPDVLEVFISSKTHMRWRMPESLNAKQREIGSNDSWSWRGAELSLHDDAAAAAEPLTVTVYMEKGATFAGRVVDPQGKPVAGAIVVTNHVGYADSIDSTKAYTGRTRADGTFRFVVPACQDAMNLIAHDGDYDHWRHWANGVTDVLDATSGAAHEDLTITLTTPATIKGQVLDRSGNAAPHKRVRVIGADDRDSRYVAPEVEADADGHFELKFVRPGDVWVQAEPFYMRMTGSVTPKIDAVPVTVAAEEAKEDVKLTGNH